MKKIILIGILICILAALIIMGYAAINNMGNSNQYERVNLSSTCSLELPKVHFDVENSNMGGSYGGITTNVDGKTLTSDKLVIQYVKVTDNTGISSSGLYEGNSYSKIGHMDWYSRDVVNLATGESILICGEDKEVVDHIADSIQFSGGKDDISNSTSNDVSTDNLKIIGYDEDGNPVYEGYEPWIWVDSEGIKHWSPEHQQAASEGSYSDQGYGIDYYEDYSAQSEGSSSSVESTYYPTEG